MYVDTLLGCRSAAKKQLTVPTVLDYLSAVKSCFLQAGITFEWPQLAYRLIRGEGSVRRRSGKEAPVSKYPFMPRVA